MGRLHIGLVATLWAGAAEPVLAAPASPRPVVEFRWDAPASCPVEAEVVAELERLLGGLLVERKGPRLTAIARVRQEPGGGFDLRLWTVSDEGTLQRSLTHAQCDALARAGALIAAMAIDPSVLERMSEETDAAEVAAEARTVEDPEPLPEPEPPAPEPEPAPAEPAQPEPEPPKPPPEKKKKERRVRGGVRLGAGLSFGDLPGVGALLRLTPALIWPRARLEFEVGYGPLRRARFDDTPDRGADLQLAVGAVRGCPLLHARKFEFPLCAGLELGALYGRGVGYEITSEARQLFVALHLAPGVFYAVHPRVAVGGIVEGAVHVVRPRFVVENLGEIYRSALASVRALLAVEVRFP
ncbi:hypothetical protein OV090_13965 [Nannocystis sp. RBIL2]|uniref:hypothetical protein n=1 Tax=Nannocystis sp. RBIL2 TaxID=2996788 RepID=UPI002271288A|nr:hypothetical protein [Nannocystis sp. RBIL2]MCY1065882.1 hypothetical protein [Nannocystis sp. RBIL2]